MYERLKRYGSRMEMISVRDLTKPRALAALKVLRGTDPADEALFDKVYELVGGRLAFLTKVAKSPDMIKKCQEICQAEKTWLLVNSLPFSTVRPVANQYRRINVGF